MISVACFNWLASRTLQTGRFLRFSSLNGSTSIYEIAVHHKTGIASVLPGPFFSAARKRKKKKTKKRKSLTNKKNVWVCLFMRVQLSDECVVSVSVAFLSATAKIVEDVLISTIIMQCH